MSKVRQSSQRRIVLAFALLASAIAACDSRATAPAEMRRAPAAANEIAGDTTACQRGWVVITGAYVCNP